MQNIRLRLYSKDMIDINAFLCKKIIYTWQVHDVNKALIDLICLTTFTNNSLFKIDK